MRSKSPARCSFLRVLSRCVIGALALVAVDCTSLYWKQRAKDGADIFTFELQTQSYGAALRAGPLKVGLNYKSPDGVGIGLRGGETGRFVDSEFALFFLGTDRLSDMKKEAAARPGQPPQEAPSSDTRPGKPTARTDEGPEKTASPPDIPSTLLLRRKNLLARSPFGTAIPLQDAAPIFKKSKRTDRFAPAHHFTGIEATLGVYLGVKIGINPGELLDWLAGFFGLDLFSDDLPDLPDLSKIPPSQPSTVP